MRPYPLMTNYKRTDHSNLIDALREWKSFSDNVENNFEQATFIFSEALKGIDELEASDEFSGKDDYLLSLIGSVARFYNLALDEYIKISGRYKPKKYIELLHLYLKDSRTGEPYIKKEYDLYVMGLANKRVEENHNIIQKRFDIKSIIVRLINTVRDDKDSDIYHKYKYTIPVLGLHLASLIDTYRMDPLQKTILTIEELNYIIKCIERNSKCGCFCTIFDTILGPAFYYINAYKDTDEDLELEDIIDELAKANWLDFDGKLCVKNTYSNFEKELENYKGLIPISINSMSSSTAFYFLKRYAEDHTIGRPKSFFNFINETDYPTAIKGVDLGYKDVFLYSVIPVLTVLYVNKTAEITHEDDRIAMGVFVDSYIKDSHFASMVCDNIKFSAEIIDRICDNRDLGNLLADIVAECRLNKEKEEENMVMDTDNLEKPSYITAVEAVEEISDLVALSEAYLEAPKFNISKDTILKFPEAIPFYEYYARNYPDHLDRDIILNRAEMVVKENAITSDMDMELAANISKVNTYRNRLSEATITANSPEEYFQQFLEDTKLLEDVVSFVEGWDSDDDDFDDDDDEEEKAELTPKEKQEQKKKVEATKKSLLSRMADAINKAGNAIEKAKPKFNAASSKVIDALATIATLGDEEKIAQLKTKILPNLRNILSAVVLVSLVVYQPYILVMMLIVNAISTTKTSVETKKIVKDELDVELGMVEKKLNTANLTEQDEKKLLMLKSKINRQIERIDKEIQTYKSKK